ncbi:hypothetical protein HYN56_03590 [Flavobacterium crocinum]|uniref:Uncharacterized protein n=1 Tax=Flavobacterium crocinum TaxID=2183896 RepID=A0A2S1YH27_9FLAO|nr:hypothetical protein HYN56_03590 [Flavobacterium crocinum]
MNIFLPQIKGLKRIFYKNILISFSTQNCRDAPQCVYVQHIDNNCVKRWNKYFLPQIKGLKRFFF